MSLRSLTHYILKIISCSNKIEEHVIGMRVLVSILRSTSFRNVTKLENIFRLFKREKN